MRIKVPVASGAVSTPPVVVVESELIVRRNFPAAPQIDMTAGDNFLAVKQHNANLNFPGSVTAEAISICRGEGEKKKEVLL